MSKIKKVMLKWNWMKKKKHSPALYSCLWCVSDVTTQRNDAAASPYLATKGAYTFLLLQFKQLPLICLLIHPKTDFFPLFFFFLLAVEDRINKS